MSHPADSSCSDTSFVAVGSPAAQLWAVSEAAVVALSFVDPSQTGQASLLPHRLTSVAAETRPESDTWNSAGLIKNSTARAERFSPAA